MKTKIIHQEKNDESLVYVNSNIKICIICGNHNIEFFEHGISCEECGTTFGRQKCLVS